MRDDLSILTPALPAMRLIMPILYMWSAMLSGPFTLQRTQPVRLDVCTAPVCTHRMDLAAVAATGCWMDAFTP
jgi:hypothetical protein